MEFLSKLVALILNMVLFFGVICGISALLMLVMPLVSLHLGFWTCYYIVIGYSVLGDLLEIAKKLGQTFE